MRLLERVVGSVYIFIVVVLAVGLLAVIAGWDEPLLYLPQLVADPAARVPVATVAVIVVVFGIWALLSAVQRPLPVQTVVQTTPLGEIRISRQALENMVIRAAHQVHGLRDVRPVLRCLPEGVAIFLQASTAPEMAVPEVTAQVQEKVRSYVEELAGVQVLEIRILVDNVVRPSPARVQ